MFGWADDGRGSMVVWLGAIMGQNSYANWTASAARASISVVVTSALDSASVLTKPWHALARAMTTVQQPTVAILPR